MHATMENEMLARANKKKFLLVRGYRSKEIQDLLYWNTISGLDGLDIPTSS